MRDLFLASGRCCVSTRRPQISKKMSKKHELGGGAGLMGEKVMSLTACGNVLLTSLFQAQADCPDKMSSQTPAGEAAAPARGPLGHGRL